MQVVLLWLVLCSDSSATGDYKPNDIRIQCFLDYLV